MMTTKSREVDDDDEDNFDDSIDEDEMDDENEYDEVSLAEKEGKI